VIGTPSRPCGALATGLRRTRPPPVVASAACALDRTTAPGGRSALTARRAAGSRSATPPACLAAAVRLRFARGVCVMTALLAAPAEGRDLLDCPRCPGATGRRPLLVAVAAVGGDHRTWDTAAALSGRELGGAKLVPGLIACLGSRPEQAGASDDDVAAHVVGLTAHPHRPTAMPPPCHRRLNPLPEPTPPGRHCSSSLPSPRLPGLPTRRKRWGPRRGDWRRWTHSEGKPSPTSLEDCR
jgi:hypothetical protein